MGHATVAIAYTYTPPHRADRLKTGHLQPYVPDDNLTNALGSISVLGMELLEHQELRPHLQMVLMAMEEHKEGAAERVVASGILPVLALSLRGRGSLTLLTTHLVAELAKDSVVCKAFGESGLGSALIFLLTSLDQDLLLLATQALSRMARDNAAHQELLLRQGAVPRLVSLLLRSASMGGSEGRAVQGACLLALCSLSDMGGAESSEEELLWEEGPSLRPEERVYRGVSPAAHTPHSGFFFSWVTLVRVACWGPGQYTCSVEVFQRCSASFWNLHGNRHMGANARRRLFPPPLFSGLASCSRWYRSLWCPVLSSNAVTRTRSLKTRMFHTFL